MNRPDITSLPRKVLAALPNFSEKDLPGILDSVKEILQSGRLILGKYTHEFEESFRRYVGTEHAVAVNSCTSALQITLRFMGAQNRDVIMPVNNFAGVVTAALSEGARPILAEMDTDSFCMDVDDAIKRVTPGTAGMIVVHVAGRICPDMNKLRDYCAENALFLIEDASHAHGAEVEGRKAGNLADAACFSFYPTKIMTTGTGGMITTDNAELAKFARSVRNHGQGDNRALFVRQGNDWCMTEIGAVLGLQQLRRLDQNVAYRNQIATRYQEGLEQEDWVTIPTCPKSMRHAYYKFPVLLHPRLDVKEFRRFLGEELLVENGTIYDPPCHLQPVFREYFGFAEGAFPKSEFALSRQFCPPIHSTLQFTEIDRVIESMKFVAAQVG